MIEVADTTLARDRDVKIPLYARHGIPEAWLFDLNARSAALCRDPGAEGYRTVLTPARDATISPMLKPGVSISLAEIWPGAAA